MNDSTRPNEAGDLPEPGDNPVAEPPSIPESQAPTTVAEKPKDEAPVRPEGTAQRALREMLSSNWLMTLLAIVFALVVGAILIAATNPKVQESFGYFFARPMDAISEVWNVVFDAYAALFQGAVLNFGADSFEGFILPLTETMTVSTPLIFAGLGLAVAFRAGVFNIGAQGQVIVGAIMAGYIGFAVHLPVGLHLIFCLIGGIAGGAIWAGIAGVLKATTGAHEVIVTIMLNYVGLYLLQYLLRQSSFQRPGEASQPKSPMVDASAELPLLLGGQFRLHLGFILALLAAVFVWFLMNRSNTGFRFRAVGENPSAARTAGISVPLSIVGVMAVAGGLAGLAGASQVLGTEHYLTGGIAGSLGFDAITVALLGRSKPGGVVMAGLLFGALSAGGRTMQAFTGTPIDIILILQSTIVLLIAAPPLVRAIFRLPTPKAKQNVSLATTAAKEAQA